MRPVILSQIGLAASAVAAILAPAPASAQSSAIRDTALSPDKFSFGLTGSGSPGEWRVVDDAGAETGRALAQLSKDRTDYRFPLAIYKPASAQNLDVVIHFKPVGGDVDRAGGVAIRLTTPDDYYVVRANALEGQCQVALWTKADSVTFFDWLELTVLPKPASF
jgi:hypothetical protein